MKITDIKAVAGIAGSCDILLCVDNTFASPVLQKPIDLGADIVVHSATKYLGGHSDLIGGLVITRNEELGDKIKFIQNASGAILSPFDSWLLIRGLETLPLRVEAHSANAAKIAEYLSGISQISNLYYPGLKTHFNHRVAAGQMSQFGAVISFDLHEDNKELASEFVSSTKLFRLAESLGGVKSLCCLPCEMTHKSVPQIKRYASGVSDSLIRLSVGLESPDDLISDLEQAFKTIGKIKNELREVQ